MSLNFSAGGVMSNDKKRKIVIINRKFQFKMIAKFILLNIILMILFSGLIYLFLNSEIDSNLKSAHVTYRNVNDMLFPIVISLSIINILLSSLIISVFVLYASFKIAGPLYRFNEALKKMSGRNLKPVTTIRAYDELYDCSVTLTEFSRIFSSDINEIKKGIDEIMILNQKGTEKKKIAEKIRDIRDLLNQYDS
jgi:uncharacterized membrane protein